MPYLVSWVLTTLYGASFWASLASLDILPQVNGLLPTRPIAYARELAGHELGVDL